MISRTTIFAALLFSLPVTQVAVADSALKGGLLGGAGGGLIGNAIGGKDGAAIGAAVGAVLGGLLAELNDADQKKRNDAAAQVEKAPVGKATAWSSSEAGTSGSLVKTSDVYDKGGKKCMNVKETVTIKGKAQEVDGVQCLVDGKWTASN
jgi:surface antigen